MDVVYKFKSCKWMGKYLTKHILALIWSEDCFTMNKTEAGIWLLCKCGWLY